LAPADRSADKRRTNQLVALGSAAVIAIYAAGYSRTRAAAERLNSEERRRPVVPAPAESGPRQTMPEPPATTVTRPVAPPSVAAVQNSRRERTEPIAIETPQPAATASAPATAVTTVPSDTTEAAAKINVPTTSALPLTSTSETKAAELTPPPPPQKPSLKDGTYYGWGTSRHGDIQARIIIEDGRIKDASIAQCLTRYSCSWIAPLVPQVVQRQSAEVDYVSGATQSTYAFYYAVLEALTKAK
jgi:uncharacterized protein with FMN-binding domain